MRDRPVIWLESNLKESSVGEGKYLWHLDVSKLVPQIFNSVDTDQSGAEQANPLHATNTANTDPSQR